MYVQPCCVSSCVFRFVEYGEHKGHLYGTSTDAVDEVLKRGRMCIIDVEPHVSFIPRDCEAPSGKFICHFGLYKQNQLEKIRMKCKQTTAILMWTVKTLVDSVWYVITWIWQTNDYFLYGSICWSFSWWINCSVYKIYPVGRRLWVNTHDVHNIDLKYIFFKNKSDLSTCFCEKQNLCLFTRTE